MKTKVIIVIVFLMMNSPNIMLNLTHDEVLDLTGYTDASTHHKAIWIDNRPHITAGISRLRERNVQGIGNLYREEKDAVMADYVYGKWYQEEYLVDLYNLAEWDADFKSSKRVKGFTRNYFSEQDGGKARLLRKVAGSPRHEYVDCMWYVDDIRVNDNPAFEFFFRMHEGSYKIEARSQDTTLISFTAVFPETFEVVFTPGPSYDGEYGFDDNKYEIIAKLNNAEYLDNKYKYIVPFISVQQNQNVEIIANLMYKKEPGHIYDADDLYITFEPSSPDIEITTYENGKPVKTDKAKLSGFEKGKMRLGIKATGVVDDGYINVRMGDRIIGKLNVQAKRCLRTLDLILVKVVINDKLGSDIELERKIPHLENLLNKKSFNQAFLHWNINRIETINLHINKNQVSLLDVYKAAVRYYKDNGLNPDDATILFVSDSDLRSDASGYAYVSRSGKDRYSIVRSNAMLNKTPVHELAHNLGLKDLNSEFKAYFYDTDNFMDYYSVANNDNRRMFWKHQWEHIYQQVYNYQNKRMLCDTYSG